MKKSVFILALVLSLASASSPGLELPFDLNFNVGFAIDVVPDSNDASLANGLLVTAEQILSDKSRTLSITGTIANCSDAPKTNVGMTFAVTSYTGIGKSFARARVEPSTIPPGGSSRFEVLVILDSENPRHALYTVTFQE